ncbi:hypothetical protein JOC55_005299 [Paenibacillus sacheonensis]|nr:hypothetical protein [Paenibacillus sacheonensis]
MKRLGGSSTIMKRLRKLKSKLLAWRDAWQAQNESTPQAA